MAELKPCSKCGSKAMMITEVYGRVYGCAVGCENICCEEKTVITYGLTKERTERRAIRKWNERAEDETKKAV